MRAVLISILCLFGMHIWAFQDVSPDRLVYAWISNNADFDSLVVVNNPGETQAALTLTARRADGTSETVTRNVAPRGFLQENAGTLFPTLGQGGGYTVTVASETTGLEGRWITFNRQTGSSGSPAQGVAVSLEDSGKGAGSTVLFGFLPDNPDFFSAPVVVNLGATPTSVALQGYDASGALIFEDNTTISDLSPMQPFAVVANDLIPPGSGDVQLIARASSPITGVVFVFNQAREPAIGNVTATSGPTAEELNFAFTFAEDLQGWQGGFADYPAGEEAFYELTFGHRALPAELETAGGGMFISGNNHSDDLFMFVKRRVTGLAANTTYSVTFRTTIATDAPAGCFGVGGAPGESVYFKLGATRIEPLAVEGEEFLTMNIEKGNQALGGEDMAVLDHVGVPTDCNNPSFLYKNFDSGDTPFLFSTDATGSAWLVLGTDSGFEATTNIFFTEIQATFSPFGGKQ